MMKITGRVHPKNSEGLYSSDGCQKSLKTGISPIRLDCIVHPRATLQRVAKYGHRYGIKFRRSEVLWMIAASPVPDDVAREAIRFT